MVVKVSEKAVDALTRRVKSAVIAPRVIRGKLPCQGERIEVLIDGTVVLNLRS